MAVEIAHDVAVIVRLQIAEAQILQLPFELLHTEPVRQRGVDVHRLAGLGDLLGRRLVLHGAHIVQPVADLDEHHADVLGHGEEHLAQIFHLLFLGRGIGRAGQLGDAFDEGGDGGAELGGDLLVGGRGVLQAVVEQRSEDGVGVEADLGHDLRHREGVDDVGRAVLALLVFVLFLGIVEGLVHTLHVGIGRVAADGLYHRIIAIGNGFHCNYSPAFCFFSLRMMTLWSRSTLLPLEVRVIWSMNWCSESASRPSS